MQVSQWPNAAISILLAVTLSAASSAAEEQAQGAQGSSPPATSGLYVKVQLGAPIKLSKLKPGDVVVGSLVRNVYSADRELFPAGSRVRLTVDSMEKRRRVSNDRWPGIIKLFTPRHEKYPVFKAAIVSGAGGESALRVYLLSAGHRQEVHAQTRKKRGTDQQAGSVAGEVEVSTSNQADRAMKRLLPTMVLEGFGVESTPPSSEGLEARTGSALPSSGLEILPAGTRCKILLLGDISASKSKPGDLVQTRLLEPVLLDSRVVLPAGSLVEGKIVKKTPPRWLSRAGSLYLTFTGLTLLGGNRVLIAATLAGAELDRESHVKIDAEGGLRGERPGKAWMAINIGVAAGLAKEADDSFQLVFEAIVDTATDASTAGTARIIAGAASGVYMITRHGRDVVLPRFTEMEISLDRPLSVTESPTKGP